MKTFGYSPEIIMPKTFAIILFLNSFKILLSQKTYGNMVVRNNFEEVSPHFKTSYLTVYPKDKVNLKGNPLVIGCYGGVVKM